MSASIRVLVVDDSAFMRRGITRLLQQDADISVIGEAMNGLQAIALAKTLQPDVITMDVEMPGISGIESVQRIMAEQPRPILMFSSVTLAGAASTIQALTAGAMDFLAKDNSGDLSGSGARLRRKVRLLAKSRVVHNTLTPAPAPAPAPVLASHASTTVSLTGLRDGIAPSLVLIGASTGGPKVIQEMLVQFPAGVPYPIVVVQHMPAQFTRAFAERLNQLSRLSVSEALSGDAVEPGHVYIAPGGLQITLKRYPSRWTIQLAPSRPDDIYKPSIDTCFRSLAAASCDTILAVVLTGMGNDGAAGAKSLFDKGAKIWTQSAPSCVIPGMPNAVQATGISALDLTPQAMVDSLLKGVGHSVGGARK